MRDDEPLQNFAWMKKRFYAPGTGECVYPEDVTGKRYVVMDHGYNFTYSDPKRFIVWDTAKVLPIRPGDMPGDQLNNHLFLRQSYRKAVNLADEMNLRQHVAELDEKHGKKGMRIEIIPWRDLHQILDYVDWTIEELFEEKMMNGLEQEHCLDMLSKPIEEKISSGDYERGLQSDFLECEVGDTFADPLVNTLYPEHSPRERAKNGLYPGVRKLIKYKIIWRIDKDLYVYKDMQAYKHERKSKVTLVGFEGLNGCTLFKSIAARRPHFLGGTQVEESPA